MVLARRAGVVLLAAGLLAGCGTTKDDFPKVTKPTYSSYVAMGDSFTSGPGITPQDPMSVGCQRSTRNYPSLLAKALDVTVVRDVSCSGATSADIVTSRPTTDAPGPQLDAVTSHTDLVTVGIGGNDEGVFGKVIFACATGTRVAQAQCSPTVKSFLTTALARTTARVATSLEAIRAKAPQARIVLVGYLRVLPEPGGCVVTGLTTARSGPAILAQDMLDTALADAAKRAKVDYVSMATSSSGHESCYGNAAWVNGFRTSPGDGAFLHPNEAGMAAVAESLARHLT
ncbi:SGNH/GDSL hydrolase family protein [Aeromicrobium panaciterrae]|uniref:SGNH/GDSL hydrolase family protein n=1 Tax=Aeromicrobium panaciterrae TaxID=363861 RepID=UPI0031DF0A83